MTKTADIYAAYVEGYATPLEALRLLCADYDELDQTYHDFEQHRDHLRTQISDVVDRLGGKVEVAGFGTLAITAPSITTGYDKVQIKALLADLAESHPDIADRLAACATKSMRSGGLRIERTK
jgi:hypothetical protein